MANIKYPMTWETFIKKLTDSYFMKYGFFIDEVHDLYTNKYGAFVENKLRRHLVDTKIEEYACYKVNYIDRGYNLVIGPPGPEFDEYGLPVDNSDFVGIYISNYIELIRNGKIKTK
jgi:hypothetical protein